jgi:acyl-coenzyme A synthetase/AMP-(fatty) acid ligase
MAFKTGDLAYKDKNGNFYIVGRNDNVVKIQGYRIDLNEIEKNMNNMPNVYAISVFVHRISNSEKELWAAIELEKNETKLDIFKIKNKLRRILPNYMIPKRLFIIPKMPLTPNGKIDKKKVENYISQNII